MTLLQGPFERKDFRQKTSLRDKVNCGENRPLCGLHSKEVEITTTLQQSNREEALTAAVQVEFKTKRFPESIFKLSRTHVGQLDTESVCH